MNTKAILLILTVFLSFSMKALADSPLTSTDFSTIYTDQAIVAEAAATSGLLTPKLVEYLFDKNNPIDVKMAVINQLSWNIDGKANAQIFLKYALKKGKYGSEEAFLQKGTTHELLCMAYLLGLDNYFDLSKALVYADVIGERADNSYTVRLIVALIRAQDAMATSWCDVYTYTNVVRTDASLTMDMRPEASALIFEYMDLYGDDCGGEETDAYEYDEEADETYYSPLTATPFASLYVSEPLISEAIASVDALTPEMMAFLADEKRPLETKMALINGLGNRPDASTNGEAFLAYCIEKGKFKDKTDFIARGKIRDLLCVAYLKAMDNVYDVTEALEYVYAIEGKSPDGYTVNIICALIEAQHFLATDWCLVYQQTNYVRENTSLRMDMQAETLEIIFGYMDLYYEYCVPQEELIEIEETGE